MNNFDETRQVKIRGFRAELGEIEAALLENPQVRDCLVTSQVPDSGPQVVAYIVPGTDGAPTVTDLQDHLRQLLPAFMIPSRFMFLKELPRTESGAIDAEALPPPGLGGPELGTPYLAPRNDVEMKIAEIWSEVLKFDEVGIHDRILQLGGDSLLATRIAVRIEEAFGLELSIRFMLETATVAALAARIQARPAESS